MPTAWDSAVRAGLVARMLALLNESARMATGELPVAAKGPALLRFPPMRYLIIHHLQIAMAIALRTGTGPASSRSRSVYPSSNSETVYGQEARTEPVPLWAPAGGPTSTDGYWRAAAIDVGAAGALPFQKPMSAVYRAEASSVLPAAA